MNRLWGSAAFIHEFKASIIYDIYLLPGSCWIVVFSLSRPTKSHSDFRRTLAGVRFIIFTQLGERIWDTLMQPNYCLAQEDTHWTMITFTEWSGGQYTILSRRWSRTSYNVTNAAFSSQLWISHPGVAWAFALGSQLCCYAPLAPLDFLAMHSLKPEMNTPLAPDGETKRSSRKLLDSSCRTSPASFVILKAYTDSLKWTVGFRYIEKDSSGRPRKAELFYDGKIPIMMSNIARILAWFRWRHISF